MPRIELSEIVPYTPQQMFDLVVDVGSYPEFLPWCVKGRRFREQENQFVAEMTVAFKGIKETFQTVDKFIPNQRVDITLLNGPFKFLESHWVFTPHGEDSCKLEFFIDFRFKSRFLDMTAGPLFHHASQRMVSAYKERAGVLYGQK